MIRKLLCKLGLHKYINDGFMSLRCKYCTKPKVIILMYQEHNQPTPTISIIDNNLKEVKMALEMHEQAMKNFNKEIK